MKVTVYLYEEAPYILENVEDIQVEGEDIILVDAVDGTQPVNMNDVLKLEVTK